MLSSQTKAHHGKWLLHVIKYPSVVNITDFTSGNMTLFGVILAGEVKYSYKICIVWITSMICPINLLLLLHLDITSGIWGREGKREAW